MIIITRRHIAEAATTYTDAAPALAAWVAIIAQVRWISFAELRRTFPDADAVDGYVVFNIRHNRYRLITVMKYVKEREGIPTQGRVYVRSFLTHREYDRRENWDRRFGR